MQETREDCEIRLEVTCLNAETTEYIDTEISVTVGAIRDYVERKYNQNYPFWRFTLYWTLFYEGQRLENDNMTLADYGWENGTIGTIEAHDEYKSFDF